MLKWFKSHARGGFAQRVERKLMETFAKTYYKEYAYEE